MGRGVCGSRSSILGPSHFQTGCGVATLPTSSPNYTDFNSRVPLQVVALILAAMAAYIPILMSLDWGWVSSPLYRLAGHIVALTTALLLFIIV